MAPRSGLPERFNRVTWSLRRPGIWATPRCTMTNQIIWPWTKAWRRRMDMGYGQEVFSTYDEWVTVDQYLLLKLKGENK